MAEQNGAQSQHHHQLVQYVTPQTLASPPQMQSSYAFHQPPPPLPQGPPGTAYRPAPHASTTSLPPVNLPPLRRIDGQQQHAQRPQLMPQPGLSHMHHHLGPPMPGFYAHPLSSMSSLSSLHHPGHAPAYPRYAPIPQGTPLGGSRAKKEIKRRTKTGCLTCRKRRIKCDEQHPACRNCQKSKRECLGYDPIFKQTGPPTLHPAPSASPPSASATPASASSVVSRFSPSQTNHSPYPPTPKTATSAIPPKQPTLHPAIDPALSESPQSDRRTSDATGSQVPIMEAPKGRPARQVRVDQLFDIDQYGPHDIPPSPPLSPEQMDEVRELFMNNYAPGLDKLLETNFYSSSEAVGKLLANHALSAELSALASYFSRPPSNEDVEKRTRATESRAVWNLLNVARSRDLNPPPGNGANSASLIDLELAEGRLEVLEHLLTNSTLDGRRIKPVPWQESWSKDKTEELLFWHSLARFVALPPSPSPSTGGAPSSTSSAAESDKHLMHCRNLLNGRENRDVVYSIMVCRHIGWRVPGFPREVLPEHGGEGSYVNKVCIAQRFIRDEAGYKGTTQVVMRICDMALRAWAIGWP